MLHTRGLLGARAGLGGEDQPNNQTVQAERLREDEDEHHADVELRLVSRGAHAGVADDANGNASREARKAAGEAARQVREALEEGVFGDATLRRRDCAPGDGEGAEWGERGSRRKNSEAKAIDV